MGSLARTVVAATMLLISPEHARASPERVEKWQPFIDEAAVRFRLPPTWIARIMQVESGGSTRLGGLPIRSRAGAIGLMQLMPATWIAMRDRYDLGRGPDDPHDNIIAGAAYLRLMIDRFGYPGAIAAYNAGPGRYAAYLAHQSGLPLETIAYLGAIAGPGIASPIAPNTPQKELIFALRHDLTISPPGSEDGPSDTGLFAVREAAR